MFALLFCFIFSYGQKNVKKYYEYVNKAELAICEFKYEKASRYYEKAFNAHTPFVFDLYNAACLNVKFTKNFDLALKYSRILQQRDFDIAAIYSIIDLKDSLIIQDFKNLKDSVKSLTNKNLKMILDQMLEEDQKQADTPQEEYDKHMIRHSNLFKLFELFEEYGPLTEQKVGFFDYSPIHTIMTHAAQNQMSPQELLLQDVLCGNINAENYMQYFDFYLEYLGKSSIYGYGWNPLFVCNGVLFIVHPDDINKTNNERKKINVAETWQEYVKKAKYQFLYGNFQMVPRVNLMMDDEEVKKMMQEIDEEHQKGIYKREYVIRESK
jgi:hypothetical protein